MKIHVSKQVYDQFAPQDQRNLAPVQCDCVIDRVALPTCDYCDGAGTIYEWSLSAEDSAAIQENLRNQGVPLGKIGTN